MSTVNEIYNSLQSFADKEKLAVYPRFFKTGKGEYGEGDRFIGVSVPHVREVARRYTDVPLAVVREMLFSPWHEMRSCGLVILVGLCRNGVPAEVYNFYLDHTSRVNNWDLVDLSAPTIVGGYLLERSREPLFRLAGSKLLWDNRIAVVSTLCFIRHGDVGTTYELAERLMHHPHDLMHKATGWMLREAGKVDERRLFDFVDAHRHVMPRTMLRYSIERFTPATRRQLMRRD